MFAAHTIVRRSAIAASLAYLPDPRFWWGAASALGFVLLLRIGPRWFRRRGRGASQCPQPVLPAPAEADKTREQSDYWESPELTEGDRRRSIRSL